MARDLGDEGQDGDRKFEFVVTYDLALVTAAAQSIAGRLSPCYATNGSSPMASVESAGGT